MTTDTEEVIEFFLKDIKKSQFLKKGILCGMLCLPFFAFSVFSPKPYPPDAADRFLWWVNYSLPFVCLVSIGISTFLNVFLRSRKTSIVLRIEKGGFLIENQYLGNSEEASEEVTVAQKDGIQYHIYSENHSVSFPISKTPADFKNRMEYFLTEP